MGFEVEVAPVKVLKDEVVLDPINESYSSWGKTESADNKIVDESNDCIPRTHTILLKN